MKKFIHGIQPVMFLCMLLATACSKDDDSVPVDNTHLVGSDAAQYSETSESTNNTFQTSESTSYTLDIKGLVISGSFEASSPTSDVYRFNTGTFNDIDVNVFVNNVKDNEENHKSVIALDAVENDGYSVLTGSGYFISAWIQPNKEWLIKISPTAPGLSYKIEMKGTL